MEEGEADPQISGKNNCVTAVALGPPRWLGVKNLPASSGDVKRCGFDPWVRRISWRRSWQVFLPGEFHGQRSLAGYSL